MVVVVIVVMVMIMVAVVIMVVIIVMIIVVIMVAVVVMIAILVVALGDDERRALLLSDAPERAWVPLTDQTRIATVRKSAPTTDIVDSPRCVNDRWPQHSTWAVSAQPSRIRGLPSLSSQIGSARRERWQRMT